MLRVIPPEMDNEPPAILSPHHLLPPPPLIFSLSKTNHTLAVRDGDTIMAAEVFLISDLPDGAEASSLRIRGDKTGTVKPPMKGHYDGRPYCPVFRGSPFSKTLTALSAVVLCMCLVLCLGEVLLSWTPTDNQTGVHMACFVAKDMYSSPSVPHCVVLIATLEDQPVGGMYVSMYVCI